MNPVTDFEIPNFNIPIPTLTPAPTLTVPEFPSQILLVLLAIIAIFASLLVYLKKPKHNGSS